ncbi:MAG: tannase/feruloyl esterase family alpha/beta hydrolase [Bryobacterales bacterium]|nr:tannase/feruloyl esterase family alpha/beta hydrolase [Bryobacterales bacterium]
MRHNTPLALRVMFLSLACCAAAWGQLPSPTVTELDRSEANCRKIAQLTVHDYSIVSAVFVDATDQAPAYCRVLGVLPPEIVFQVVLPAAWNGRILMNGNGGYAGNRLDGPGLRGGIEALAADGYVSVRTNTGHDRNAEPLATFALNNRQKEIDYSFRAVRLTIQTTKELTEMYYGRPANYTYWQGCSTGGRQGLMAAQRFPEDFDGIIVGAPVLDFTNTQIWGAWNAKALDEAPISLAKVDLLAQEIYSRCDSIDGLKDGLLEDPRVCDFDPARDLPRCADGSGDGCFSAAELTTLQKIYGGVVSRGEVLFPGLPFGSEATPPMARRPRSGWNGWIIQPDGPSRQQVFAETFLRYMAFEPDDPDYDWRSFDYDEDPHRMDFIRSILDATNPDLTGFRDAGGKMLMYFGWADTALNPMMGVNYYEDVQRVSGPGVDEYFRLFMVPGMFHCGGGLGVSRVDYRKVLIDWVESGKVPERLVAARVVEGRAEMTRPLCPYPEVAKYDGQGDPNSAESFACVSPAPR